MLGAAVAALVIATAEGASWLALRLARPYLTEEIRTTAQIYREQSDRIRALIQPDTARLLVVDSVLGWRYRAGHRDAANRTNAQDLRSDRQYSARPRPGVLRVAAFGNSFVYCNEVSNEAAWPRLVEQLSPDIEVLNYGVGGYGLDQAYLRYLEEGTRLSPEIVIVGFTPDDLGRVVNVYRRFRSNREIPLIKPRYLLRQNGDLELLPTPVRGAADYARYLADPRAVRDLGRYDEWYEPLIYDDPMYDYSATVRLLTATWMVVQRRYFRGAVPIRHGVFDAASAAFRIQMALFHRFADAVHASGRQSLVLLLPDRESVERARSGRRPVLASLMDAMGREHLDYVDATAAFVQSGRPERVDAWFMPGGHYSQVGNRLVAMWLAQQLRSRAPVAATPGAPVHRYRLAVGTPDAPR